MKKIITILLAVSLALTVLALTAIGKDPSERRGL
jgi:ABC-type uncharacterized transport system permease subunit